jgi:hypothetical protein
LNLDFKKLRAMIDKLEKYVTNDLLLLLGHSEKSLVHFLHLHFKRLFTDDKKGDGQVSINNARILFIHSTRDICSHCVSMLNNFFESTLQITLIVTSRKEYKEQRYDNHCKPLLDCEEVDLSQRNLIMKCFSGFEFH